MVVHVSLIEVAGCLSHWKRPISGLTSSKPHCSRGGEGVKGMQELSSTPILLMRPVVLKEVK